MHYCLHGSAVKGERKHWEWLGRGLLKLQGKLRNISSRDGNRTLELHYRTTNHQWQMVHCSPRSTCWPRKNELRVAHSCRACGTLWHSGDMELAYWCRALAHYGTLATCMWHTGVLLAHYGTLVTWRWHTGVVLVVHYGTLVTCRWHTGVLFLAHQGTLVTCTWRTGVVRLAHYGTLVTWKRHTGSLLCPVYPILKIAL